MSIFVWILERKIQQKKLRKGKNGDLMIGYNEFVNQIMEELKTVLPAELKEANITARQIDKLKEM